MLKVKLSEFLDKLVLLFAMLLFTYVGVTAIQETQFLDSLAGNDRPLLSQMTLNAPQYEAQPPEIDWQIWHPPTSQSRGKEWVFDVFTPPVIYYDPNAQEFAVTPPSQGNASEDELLWARFELELLEVRLRPYRLQLVGYAGEPGNYVAYLEQAATGEIVLMREGQEIADLGIRLLSFTEQQVEIQQEDSMTVLQSVGVARLEDKTNGQEISLTNLETKMFSDLEARVRVMPEGSVHLLKSGSRLELDNSVYIVGDLSAQPEEAIITKVSKDGSRRLSKTLTPVSKPELRPRGSQEADRPVSPFAIRPNRGGSTPQG